MDVLRAALGESTLNYLGSSYGTKLGATYAQLFPAAGRPLRARRRRRPDARHPRRRRCSRPPGSSVRSTPTPPTASRRPVGCFLGSPCPRWSRRSATCSTRWPQQPLPAGDRELTAGNAFYGIAVTLYSKAYWVLLSNALRMALAGDGTGLMVLADAYAARNADGTFQNNSMEAFLDISCLDDP